MSGKLIFSIKKMPLQGSGYQDFVRINQGNQRASDNFVNLSFQDSAGGGKSANLVKLLEHAQALHQQNLSGLPTLRNAKAEYQYVTIFCREESQPESAAFPIINAVEGYARHKETGEIVEDSRFMGLLFASHIRDANRPYLDKNKPRELATEDMLKVLAQAPFHDPKLKLPPPIYMISRRGDHEKSPLPTRTEAFFNALGMGCVTHNAFAEHGGADFRYLTCDQVPTTVINSPDSGALLAEKGIKKEQLALVTALGWPLFSSIQPQLYPPNKFANLPMYDHTARLDGVEEQKDRALAWLNQDKIKNGLRKLGAKMGISADTKVDVASVQHYPVPTPAHEAGRSFMYPA